MNLEIRIEELSLPHGSNPADLDHQISGAIDEHLNQDASKLFKSSNALEAIREHIASATGNQPVASDSRRISTSVSG